MEKLVIQSDINNIIEVERFVYSVCDTFNIYNYSAVISVSLLEAVKNAIVHGNNGDASKEVTITFDQCRGGVYFTVSDEGNGFDFRSAMKDKSVSDSNNGLFLMRSLSDVLSFQKDGSTVRLDFIINGIQASRALERITTLRRYYAREVVEV